MATGKTRTETPYVRRDLVSAVGSAEPICHQPSSQPFSGGWLLLCCTKRVPFVSLTLLHWGGGQKEEAVRRDGRLRPRAGSGAGQGGARRGKAGDAPVCAVHGTAARSGLSRPSLSPLLFLLLSSPEGPSRVSFLFLLLAKSLHHMMAACLTLTAPLPPPPHNMCTVIYGTLRYSPLFLSLLLARILPHAPGRAHRPIRTHRKKISSFWTGAGAGAGAGGEQKQSGHGKRTEKEHTTADTYIHALPAHKQRRKPKPGGPVIAMYGPRQGKAPRTREGKAGVRLPIRLSGHSFTTINQRRGHGRASPAK